MPNAITGSSLQTEYPNVTNIRSGSHDSIFQFLGNPIDFDLMMNFYMYNAYMTPFSGIQLGRVTLFVDRIVPEAIRMPLAHCLLMSCLLT